MDTSGFLQLRIAKWRIFIIQLFRLVLARVVPENKIEEFKKYPLSLFIMRVKKDDSTLNNIKIIAMKEKMGTRQLPTAELLL